VHPSPVFVCPSLSLTFSFFLFPSCLFNWALARYKKTESCINGDNIIKKSHPMPFDNILTESLYTKTSSLDYTEVETA